jgi:hypothetical protein
VNLGTAPQTKNGTLGVNGLAVFGNTLLGGVAGSNAYLNFGATSGTGGYGIRDNAGVIESKNSGGSWGGVVTSAGGTVSVSSITFPDATVQTTAGPSFGFGGVYDIVSGGCFVANPYASNTCACPSGFTSVPISNTNGEGGRDLYWCFYNGSGNPVTGKTFGGFYYKVSGTCDVGNPLNLGSCSCATGYTSVAITNVNGEGGRDLYWCYK